MIAVIPAKGLSKRLPNKNIREFHGKPIIAYSIEVALRAYLIEETLEGKLFEAVYVSTDSQEVAAVAQKYGARVIIRPPHLTADEVGTKQVAAHVLGLLKTRPEFVCVIYPCAPLIAASDILRGLEAIQNSGKSVAFAAGPAVLQRTFALYADGSIAPSKVIPELYQDAGAWYWYSAAALEREVDEFGPDSIAIPLPAERVQDIDTESDWQEALRKYAGSRT